MKSPEEAAERPRSFFFPLQKATVEELLSDMTLDPFLDGGPLSLALAPEHPPQLLLSPNLDIPGPCPNVEPAENPLRQLLVPEDGACQLWGGRGRGSVPLTLSQSLFPSPSLPLAAATAQRGSSR